MSNSQVDQSERDGRPFKLVKQSLTSEIYLTDICNPVMYKYMVRHSDYPLSQMRLGTPNNLRHYHNHRVVLQKVKGICALT